MILSILYVDIPQAHTYLIQNYYLFTNKSRRWNYKKNSRKAQE